MIKLALTNLGQYNEGRLNFTWVTLPITNEDLEKAYKIIGIDGVQYEEYFITDWECDFEGIEIGQYSNIDNLNEIAEKMENMNSNDLEVLSALMENYGYDFEQALEKIDDTLCLEIDNSFHEEFSLADAYIEMLGGIEQLSVETLMQYFDYEKFGRDLKMDFTIASNGIATSDY